MTRETVPMNPLQRSASLTLTCACACALAIASCGTSAQRHEAQQLENVSILSATVPLSERLVTQKEIASASDAAAVRTFLHVWSLLQFQSWDQVTGLFLPALREAIGPSLLSGALEAYTLIWQATKPRIISAHASANTAVITFAARDERDGLLPASISFRRGGGGWQVSYFSLLDGALQRSVQLRVQAQIDPLATKPAANAVRQGDAAGSLQSAYLERQLRSGNGAGAVP